MPEETPESQADSLDSLEKPLEKARLAQETHDERRVWWFLGYFLFGIHVVAFVMIYAVRHGH